MKYNIPIYCGLAVLICQPSLAANPAKPVFRDAATHQQLVAVLKRAQQNDPMGDMQAARGDDPSKVNKPVDLLEQSDVIAFNGIATLVPKRAILALPARYKERSQIEPGSKIVGWLDFYANNRGWITTVEVSRAQAEGNAEIAEEIRDRISKSSNLVVATYMGGPISVLPPKVPEPNEEPTNNKSMP
jgi:hypothetical protein